MPPTPTISSPAESDRSVRVERNFHSALHTVIISLITTLGGYLELQYQSKKKSPLEEHRHIMVAIYVNLFMYGMGLMIEFKLKTCCGSRCISMVKRVTPLFGIAVVVLIMIILFPVLGFVALVIWALVTMEVVIKLMEEFLQWFWPIFIHFKYIVTCYFNRVESPSSEIQENVSASVEAYDFLREYESLV